MTHSLTSSAAAIQTPSSPSNRHSLAVLWARKYYLSVTPHQHKKQSTQGKSITAVDSLIGRSCTAKKVLQNLNLASAQAWSLTEKLLSREIFRHRINPELVNPLEIAAHTRNLFQKALNAYSQGVEPQQLSVIIGQNCGSVRGKYTSIDPRAIGFVSMQFHYTGQKVMDCLSPAEQKLFAPYLKVMDDHMYMPLQAAYDAAGNHTSNSPALIAVQHLLPISSQIAHKVYESICRQNPGYQSYSGSLTGDIVKISSIRDAEMFQVYLCLCLLEGNIRSVQAELFPLCVMLYPPLRVSWSLVQEMLLLIGWEMQERLLMQDVVIFLPYLRTLSEMFSKEVFSNG